VSRKLIIWIAMFAGSIIGGYIAKLLGAPIFSFSYLLGNSIGAVAGVWIGSKIADGMEI